MKDTKHEGQRIELDTGDTKWQAQELGVNSNVPLVDAGTGKPYIIRRFEFKFDPSLLNDIKNKKRPVPTQQELFNSNWRQIEITLWGDGLIVRKDIEPRVLVFKKHYQIILLCEPRMGVMVIDKPRTLQELTPSKRLTKK